MAWYPQNATGLNYISYPAGPTPVGLGLTASASANTKGSYAQLVASTTFTCNSVQVVVANTITTGTRYYLFDVATGAGGSETVVIPNIPVEGAGTATSALYASGIWPVPLAIASGTRVALRCQGSTGSVTMNVSMTLIAAGGVAGVSSVTNYGSDTSTSLAVSVDPGASANTKGSYSQITASTSSVTQWLQTMFALDHTSPANTFWLVDIATGAAASEVVLMPDLLVANAGTQAAVQPKSYDMLTYIANATRIAVRCSCTSNTATTRLLSVAMLATAAPSEPSGGGGAFPYVG